MSDLSRTLIMVMISLYGFFMGFAASDVETIDDCETLGKFRSSGKVYECHVQNKDKEQ